MKKLSVLFIAFCCFATTIVAQEYTTALGFRGGFYTGLTVKHFVKEDVAIEGILATRWSGFHVTGLYEVHKYAAFDVPRLNWYYGAGAHIGFYNSRYAYPEGWGTVHSTGLGIDGIIGIEYNIEEIPINFSLDWKPMINLIGRPGFWGDSGALSARYYF